MRTLPPASLLVSWLVGFIPAAQASPLAYRWTAGETNVYAVRFSVTDENGTETSLGNIFLETKSVDPNQVTLGCRGELTWKREQPMTPGRPIFGGWTSSSGMIFPDKCELDLDLRGQEIRNSGDYPLPAPLGKLVQSLFPRLPEHGRSLELSEGVNISGDPTWLGPGEVFVNPMMGGQIFGYRHFGYPTPRIDWLRVQEDSVCRMQEKTAGHVKLTQTAKFTSLSQTDGTPYFLGTNFTELDFDMAAGCMTSVESRGDACSRTPKTLRHAQVAFSAHRIVGEELAKLLAPPPTPPPPRELSESELAALVVQLKSADPETRRNAIRSLSGVRLANPSPEAIHLIAAESADSDSGVRGVIIGLLAQYATTNEVPDLIHLAHSSDYFCRQTAIQTLGKLRDPRAIPTLVEVIARGGTFNNATQDAAHALTNYGTTAEPAVRQLLITTSNADTLRELADVLKDIGTADSLAPLQKLVGDPDQSLNQSVENAIQAIKERL